jgi:DNA-binding NarL/FixJ family response regulator
MIDRRSIRVVLVDDQELVRAGFRALLDAEPEIEVVAEASTGIEAIDAVEATEPDVVLMDIRMPHLDGISATHQLRDRPGSPQILILTTFDTDENVFDALEAGAAGFLVKDTPPTQLLAAIRAAVEGGAVISPAATRRLIDHVVTARMSEELPTLAALDELTEREREVLHLVALGCSNREIATRLTISELTAKTHVSRLLTKLGVQRRGQAAAIAYRAGIARLRSAPAGPRGPGVPPSS